MDQLDVVSHARPAHPSVTDEVLQFEHHAAGKERRSSSHKRPRTEVEDPAACAETEAPGSPAIGDSKASSPAAAASVPEEEAAAGHSAKERAALTPAPAAAVAVGNQPQPVPAVAAAAAPSIQCNTPSKGMQSAEEAAAMLAQKAGGARAGVSSRGTAAALQGKAAKARLQRAKARLERRAAVKESDVDMFKESCVIC